MARRRFQRGSLKWDKDRWVMRWREDVKDPVTGEVRRVRKWDVLSGKAFPKTNKRMAQREMERHLDYVNSLDHRPSMGGTFADFADRWKSSIMGLNKPSTQRTQTWDIERLLAAFGKVHMSAINAESIQAWTVSLDMEPKTVRNLIITFKSLWKTAKAWGYVSHDPFQGIKLPKWKKGNVYHFSLEQQLAIIAAAKRPWHKVFFRMLGETGVRAGESAGLRPEDVGEGSIKVTQSVWKGKIQTPKNDNAIREIPISSGLAAQLRAHIEAHPNSHGLVFINEAGKPINTDHFVDKVLKPILKRLGIMPDRQCGLYAFRHGHGTMMDSMRVPLKIRQSRLGHADPETILLHYTEPISAEERAVAEQIGEMFEVEGTVQ